MTVAELIERLKQEGPEMIVELAVDGCVESAGSVEGSGARDGSTVLICGAGCDE